MSLRDETTLHIVLQEGATAEPLSAEDRYSTIASLLERGYAVSRRTDSHEAVPGQGSPTLHLGRFTSEPEGSGVEQGSLKRSYNIKSLNAAQVADVVESVRGEVKAAAHGQWKPWFPVIDYDRCTNCMQCLSFCLFGVYGV
ncbi:MAG TPA: ferredoxin family protein, partial [Chthoniobacteraceae bacterium]